MVEFPELSLIFDGAQTRLKDELLASLIYGGDPEHGWSETHLSNVWVDPITRTAMLTPAPFSPSWPTSGAGIYARVAKSGFSIPTPGDWEEMTLLHASDYYLVSRGASEVVTLGSSVGENRGLWVSYFPHNTTTDEQVQLKFGWANDSAEVWLYSSGRAEVYRYGDLDGVYSIATPQKSGDAKKGSGTAAAVSKQGGTQYIGLVAIPCRRRELLVVTSEGGGFSHVFADISETDVSPTITESGAPWFEVPQGRATVQLAPLQFQGSGYIASRPSLWRVPPPTGSTFNVEAIYDDSYTGSTDTVAGAVRDGDDAAAFTANGTNDAFRIRATLGGSNIGTPFVYAVITTKDATTDETDDSEEADVTQYAVRLELDIPEDGSPAVLDVEFRDPRAMEAAGIDRPDYMARRPVQLKVTTPTPSTFTIFEGRNAAPDYSEATVRARDSFEIKVLNLFDVLDQYRFRDDIPLWGKALEDAFDFLAKACGLESAQLDLPVASGINLGAFGAPSDGDFGEEIKAGDKAGEVWREIFDTYVGLWWSGEYPTTSGVVLRVIDEADLSATPDVVLYEDFDEAYAAALVAGFSAEDARTIAKRYTYRDYDEIVLEPESNDIWVTGMEPRSKRPILSHLPDAASQNPTTAPSLRPLNWIGEVRPFGYVNEFLTSVELTDLAANALYPRLTARKTIAQFSAEALFKDDYTPVWRGDLVDLAHRGQYRVLGGKAPLESVKFSTRPRKARRDGRYVLRYVGPSSIE